MTEAALSAQRRSIPPGLLVLALTALGFAAYLPCLRIPAWETDTWVIHLLAQRALHSSSWTESLSGIRFILDNPKGWSDFFILASWFALYAVAGPSLWVFHVAGLMLHCAAGALLFGFARRHGASVRAAAWAAAWFLLSPLNQDVVAVEAHSQYPLFGVLFLGALALGDRWRRTAAALPGFAAALLFVLALGTKELAFALPVMLFFEAIAATRRADCDWRARRRNWIGFAVASVLALPFLIRPFWVALAAPERATSPADAAMLRDLISYLHPATLVPKFLGDLGRWMVVPFAAEGLARAAWPWNLALAAGTFGIAAFARWREPHPAGLRLSRAALLLVLGYLPVGFQLDVHSFEKTGELYLATLGAALFWGELLGGATERLPRVRAILGCALAVAMVAHLQLLHAAMRVHGERVEAARRSLATALDTTPREWTIVVLGEEKLDRGAIDAVVLALAHDRGSLLREVSWIGGSRSARPVERCPADAIRIDAAATRFLRWNDARLQFDELLDPGALRIALEWHNPDPERIWMRDVCVNGPATTLLHSAEVLADLRPETILPRL